MSRISAAAAHTVTLQQQQTLSDYVTAIAWSPDGQWLAAASAAGDIVAYQPPHTQIVLQSPQGLSINGLAFSADSQFLAAAGQAGEVTVWRVQSPMGSILFQQSNLGVWIDQLAWRPMQNQLAVGVGPGVQVWQVETGDRLAQLDFQTSSALHLAWRPTGRYLAVSGHGGVKVWDANHWQTPPQVVTVPGASIFTAWSPDGRYLGSGNLDRTLTVVEWGSPPPWLMQGFPGKVRQLSWSPPLSSSDSPLLAAACAEGVTVWARERQGGSWKSQVLQHHRGVVEAIAFQPNSLLLASASQDGQIGLWRQGKHLSQTLQGFSQGVSRLAWSAAGEQLVAGGMAGELRVWRVSHRAKGFG
ncbi:MAG: hypothetical protein MJA27_18655 [Pseudanabaenales cyanobacterium]|nr:hypothetical protein [Pseudanabaenales cyanobacterium]